eukprot:7854919-Pyramimonas_sp.AAC.1
MASIDKRVCGWGTGAPAAVAGGTAPRAPRAGPAPPLRSFRSQTEEGGQAAHPKQASPASIT